MVLTETVSGIQTTTQFDETVSGIQTTTQFDALTDSKLYNVCSALAILKLWCLTLISKTNDPL